MLNFDALDQPVSTDELASFSVRSDRLAYCQDFIPRWSKAFVMIMGGIFMFIIGMGVGLVVAVLTDNAYMTWFTAILVTALSVYFIGEYAKRKELQALAIGARIFAFIHDSQGFIYRAATTDESTGIIFGGYANDHMVIEAPDGAFRIGNIRRIISTEDTETTYQWGYLAIRLPKMLPHMILDGKRNNESLLSLNRTPHNGVLVGNLDKGQKMSLEGQFDRYFSLYAPKEYEQEALYVFTPDLMALLIDNVNDYDAEVVGNQLFIYVKDGLRLDSSAVVRKLIRAYEAVATKLLKQTVRYQDTSSPVKGAVASEGAKLGTRSTAVVTRVVVCVLLTIVFLSIIL